MPRPVVTEDVFRAVADPTRRALIEALGDGAEVTVGDLAEGVGQSVAMVSRHLAVLRAAGVVEERPAGRHRFYRLNPAPLRQLYDWAGLFTGFWNERVTKLHQHLERKHET
ncbi:ArsR/SmtB family transcription factor [Dactylosporangium sp. NPDC051541]|uniref:ArsR/SmtB family transcription factor n=1 Tax=Dactylosporangium sp. NPDC051541 TaxID=3363977 RepID=UPI00378FE04B